jgi:hypothetical protein
MAERLCYGAVAREGYTKRIQPCTTSLPRTSERKRSRRPHIGQHAYISCTHDKHYFVGISLEQLHTEASPRTASVPSQFISSWTCVPAQLDLSVLQELQ